MESGLGASALLTVHVVGVLLFFCRVNLFDLRNEMTIDCLD